MYVYCFDGLSLMCRKKQEKGREGGRGKSRYPTNHSENEQNDERDSSLGQQEKNTITAKDAMVPKARTNERKLYV